jgi:hypothetical protein
MTPHPLQPARDACATRLRTSAIGQRDEARILAEADKVQAGERDGSWGMKHAAASLSSKDEIE